MECEGDSGLGTVTGNDQEAGGAWEAGQGRMEEGTLN